LFSSSRIKPRVTSFINLRGELALIRKFQGRDDSAHCLSASFFKHHHDVAL
jgi:hypothetical protein